MSLEFAAPIWLTLIVAAAVSAILYGRAFILRSRVSHLAIHPALDQLLVRRMTLTQCLRALLILLAMIALAVALAKPQWGLKNQSIDREGRDFLLLIDVSISMLAEDTAPNRLTSAIRGIEDFVDKVSDDGGHRLALVAFAGRATPTAPLTLDYQLFLDRLRTISTESSIRRGSEIGVAIRQALYGLGDLDYEFTDIIVVSDGEDHGSAPLDAAKVAAGLGVSIHSVGIGDSNEGALIPYANTGDSAYVKIENTEIVSRMHPGLLVEIARLTGGQFLAAGTETPRLGQLYEDVLRDKPRRQLESVASERPIHRYQWFVALALALLVLEALLAIWPAIRPTRTPSVVRRYLPGMESLGFHTRSGVAAFALLVATLSAATPAMISADNDDLGAFIGEGNEFYERGDYHGAADSYAAAASLAPDSAAAHFNLATAQLKLYDYAGAIENFTLALQNADPTLATRANYNLGVVKHQQAIGNMMTFQDAMTPLESAIDYYRASLDQINRAGSDSAADESLAAADSSDDTKTVATNARFNLELAHRLRRDLINQRVLPQANAKTREQKTSDNKGQLHNEDGNRPAEELPDDKRQQEQGKDLNSNGLVSNQNQQNNSENQSTLVQRGEAMDLNATDAMKAVELARQRAESMTSQRAQWRRARMDSDEVEKFW